VIRLWHLKISRSPRLEQSGEPLWLLRSEGQDPAENFSDFDSPAYVSQAEGILSVGPANSLFVAGTLSANVHFGDIALQGGYYISSPTSVFVVRIDQQGQIAQPRLQIQHGASGILVTWPSAPDGYLLEETSNLLDASWRPSTRSTSIEDGHHTAEIAAPAAPLFFRLRK
jgi:hypothetical protein